MIDIPADRLRDHLSGDGGGRFEKLWFDLLHADALACGIPANKIHWDDRTNIGDGGRDLIIERGSEPPGLFIPIEPSIWSIKSGKDAKAPSTLRNEIDEKNHPKVVAALKSGSKYFHCTIQPIKEDEREALREAADEIADELQVPRERIDFWHSTELAKSLELFPGIVGNHLEHLLPAPEFLSVEEWERHHSEADWTDFGERSELVKQLRSHLLKEDARKTLHIGGISGIGKTRAALEAVLCDELRTSVVYFESYERFERTSHWLSRNQKARALIVIDEVDIEQYAHLQQKTLGFGPDVRILSIGPVRRGQPSRPELLVVPEPREDDDVLAVLRNAAGATVREEVLRVLAPICNHDLRLGLLLLRVLRNDPELAENPARALEALAETTAIYRRVLDLFAAEISKAPSFEDDFPSLTFSDDIGCKEERAEEIKVVAERLQKDLPKINATAEVATRCGLGTYQGRYFEAGPRALAVMVFQDILWPTISGRLSVVLEGAPDRLLQSFVRRVELCSDNVKEEVRRECGDFFRQQLADIEIRSMEDRSLARSVRAWCELYPEDGLSWLQDRITSASPEELSGLHGSTGMFGPSGGRRDLVWACEHLACFADHFDACEAILFALACAENESIGNNATSIWQEKFRHVLSHTEAHFSHRCDVLLRRLRSASPETIELILGAVAGTLEPHLSAMSPPAIIGGRIVPPEWRPATDAEAREMINDLVSRSIEGVEGLGSVARSAGAAFIANNVRAFWRPPAHEQLRSLLVSGNLSESEVRDLRARLREIIDLHGDKFVGADLMEAWIQDLAPDSLSDRVKDVVSRPVWEHQQRARRESGDDDWKAPYREVADEVVQQPAELRALLSWLESKEAQSSRALGSILAEIGESLNEKVLEIVLECLATGHCEELVTGFLAAAAHEQGGLPTWAAEALDRLSFTAPDRCALLTAEVDISRAGLDRLIRCCETSGTERSRPLSLLYGAPWEHVLAPEDQARVLELLLDPPPPTDQPQAQRVAVHLVTMWRHRKSDPVPQELHSAIVRLVTGNETAAGSRSSYEWTELARIAIAVDPQLAVNRLCELAFGEGGFRDPRRDSARKLLQEFASQHGEIILAFIGSQIATNEGRLVFFMGVFRGLFEAIGPEAVIDWIRETGDHAAHAVARHIQSPHLDAEGNPIVPLLTDWLLREYGDDEKFFREFLCGRHSFEVRTGHAWDWGPAIQASAEPFLDHEITAVRRWAQHEIDEVNRDIERDRRMLEEEGRE